LLYHYAHDRQTDVQTFGYPDFVETRYVAVLCCSASKIVKIQFIIKHNRESSGLRTNSRSGTNASYYKQRRQSDINEWEYDGDR